MRPGKILFLLAILLLMPKAADAQPAVFRMMTAPLRMVPHGLPVPRIGHRGRHHRKAAQARHPKAVPTRRGAPAAVAAPAGAAAAGAAAAGAMADPGGQTSGLAQGQDTPPARSEPVRAEPGWAGPVYWPHASDDLFDYVFRGAG